MTKSAKPDTWMPLVIGDYKKDTGRLTRDLHGGYLLLIMEYWTTGPLADDDAELAAIVLATPREWKAIRPKLARFFQIDAGIWRHKRIDAELAEATERKARESEKGRAGAAARWGNKDGPGNPTGNARGKARAKPEQCPPPSPQEVDAHRGQSTLLGRERPEARHDGASGLRVIDGGQSEREAWLTALRQAEHDFPHFSETDPEFASEIGEFITVACEHIDTLGAAA
jgi:uncharacterized protein YdaU (DUF1376 family)